jgi:hypothetical protein
MGAKTQLLTGTRKYLCTFRLWIFVKKNRNFEQKCQTLNLMRRLKTTSENIKIVQGCYGP